MSADEPLARLALTGRFERVHGLGVRGGTADDTIKPVPVPQVIQRGGTDDDSLKPGPKPIQRGGQNDDGLKPVPKANVQRGGKNDDGI